LICVWHPLETLAELERQGQGGQFDLVFIDADKANYPTYLEHALRLLRVGGLAVFDNTLWSGRVLEERPLSADTRAIQALNRALKDDSRLDLSMLPLGDGLTLCRNGDPCGLVSGLARQAAVQAASMLQGLPLSRASPLHRVSVYLFDC
jgi:predicted O-methyltransferase YrrM